jgi:hypothetical protein
MRATVSTEKSTLEVTQFSKTDPRLGSFRRTRSGTAAILVVNNFRCSRKEVIRVFQRAAMLESESSIPEITDVTMIVLDELLNCVKTSIVRMSNSCPKRSPLSPKKEIAAILFGLTFGSELARAEGDAMWFLALVVLSL